MPITPADHVTEALARLPSRYRDQANVEALVRILVGPVQTLEDAIWTLLDERGVDTATGVTLDAIGDLVGEKRAGQTDDEYRPYLRARIAANRSGGNVASLIRVARALLADSSIRVRVTAYPPASVEVRLYGAVTDAIADALIVFLKAAKAAGVRLFLVSSTAARSGTFRFARTGFAAQVNALAGGISLGYVTQTGVSYYDAHAEIPTTGGYAWLQGNESDGTPHSEVVEYDSLNRQTTPDRYELQNVVTYQYDLLSGGSGFDVPPEARPLFPSTDTGFVGAIVVPADCVVTIGDDVSGDDSFTVPAGNYSITVLADLMTYLASQTIVAGFSYTAADDDEITTVYGGPGTESSQEPNATAVAAIGVATYNSTPSPSSTPADGPVASTGAGGVWASARAAD